MIGSFAAGNAMNFESANKSLKSNPKNNKNGYKMHKTKVNYKRDA